jgi:two-component system, NtrC family, nitrogen regulation sensor histidine kinase NtrY
VQVTPEEGDDEIAMLGRLFNQMTRQLKGQRDALIEGHRQTEARRLFDSVLSSVTAGVIGLDAEGRVDFLNRSARRLLDLPDGAGDRRPAGAGGAGVRGPVRPRPRGAFDTVQEEMRLTARARWKACWCAWPAAQRGGAREGYVVAFDDVTELVSAQRMAAWGDVARRIAHEIKNPLTPIQLSAERIKRKFAPRSAEEDGRGAGHAMSM